MTQQNNASQGKVHLISLGCSRNLTDSEVILGSMIERGWEISETPEGSDAIVVNTCGFIESAKEESVSKILDAAEFKDSNPNMKLVVAGCLTQRYKNQLVKGLPEVDLFIGTDEFPQLPTYLEEHSAPGTVKASRRNYIYEGELPRINTLSKSSAYLKVAEGCQHSCSFCIIPAIRGPLRSRSIESTQSEAMKLVSQGVREVNLIAQDLAAFGRDTGNADLLSLLKSLSQVEDLDWIRLLYVYPENITAEFLDFWSKSAKVLPYIDVPMQHASDKILTSMKRQVTRAQLEKTVATLRSSIPQLAIRTSVMVGFPGETEADFEELMDFVKSVKFDHLGCFQYSDEHGTAAHRLPNHIDPETKQERFERIMELQQKISKESLKQWVGRETNVLVKGPSAESALLFEARLPQQAPEVDGVVLINGGPVQAGQIQRAKITESHSYDLVGHIL